MDGLENVISVLDYVLDTKRKKTYYGRYSVECLLSFWQFGNNRNDN